MVVKRIEGTRLVVTIVDRFDRKYKFIKELQISDDYDKVESRSLIDFDSSEDAEPIALALRPLIAQFMSLSYGNMTKAVVLGLKDNNMDYICDQLFGLSKDTLMGYKREYVDGLEDYVIDHIHIDFPKFVFVINGKPQSGKDTFVECAIDRIIELANPEDMAEARLFVRSICNISSIDYVRNIINQIDLTFGISSKKDELRRACMSDMKKVLDNYHGINDRYVAQRLLKFYNADYNTAGGVGAKIAFVHVREPENIDKMVKTYGAIPMYIDRDVEPITSNTADANVENYDYTLRFENTSIEDYIDQIYDFVNRITGKHSITFTR